MSVGTLVLMLAEPTNAGFGAVRPLAAVHCAQSCPSVRVTVAPGTDTRNPLLSGATVTPLGRYLSTAMRVVCAGTTHRVSVTGASVGIVHPPSAPAAAVARSTGVRKRSRRGATGISLRIDESGKGLADDQIIRPSLQLALRR